MLVRRLIAVGSGPILLLAVPSTAAAHLVSTGMGPVYDGIGHLLLTPEDLVAVLALAMYAGMRGAKAGRRAMFLLPPAWFLGGIAGSAAAVNVGPSLPACSFMLLGALIAADLSMPASAFSVLAILLGLVHGFVNGAVLRGGSGALGLVGVISALFVLVTLLSAFVASLKRQWARVAVRVAGSWIAAIGVLLFGWSMR